MNTRTMAKQRSFAKDKLLIEEVKKHRNLYDRRDAQFKQKISRNEAWDNISFNLQTDRNICKTRWRSIRDRFVKVYSKKLAGGIRDDALSANEWILLPHLDFLVEYVITGPSVSAFETGVDSAINDIQLIEEVNKHQSLYANNTLGYRNKRKRAEAWATISCNLRTEEAICQRRWRSIRDRFVKIRSKRNLSGGNTSEDTDDVDWYLLPYLEFLNDYLGKKKRRKNKNQQEIEINDVDIDYNSVEQNLNDDFSYEGNIWDNSCPILNSPDSKRRRTETETQGEVFTIIDCPSPATSENVNTKSESDVHEQMCNLLDRIRDLTEKKFKNEQDIYTNKNIHFLKMVDEKLEQISPHEREDAKMFILNYLHKLTKD